jgi:hypothetical protein
LKRRTFTAAALVVSSLALTACEPPEPKLPDLRGENFASAYKAADEAGYELIHARMPTSTSVGNDNDLASAPDNLPAQYESWTVCWNDTLYVDVGDVPFWSIDLYLVAERADCKNGRLDFEKREVYDELVKNAGEEEDPADGEEVPADGEEDDGASCYSSTWGNFACETGLPAPDERNLDGTYKYSICDEGEEAYVRGCYPYYDELQRWHDTHP